MAEDPLVVFLPSGRRGRFSVGTGVLDAARLLGVGIDSICGGRGLCGRCQIEVSEGEFPKFDITSRVGHLSPPGELEAEFAAREGLAAGRRLGCACRISGDAVIDVPAESLLHRQIVRKEAEHRAVEIDRVVRLHYVEMAPPSIEDQRSDLERLQAALEAQWGIEQTRLDNRLLPILPALLRESDWKITVALRENRDIIALRPGFHDRAYGLAIDLGTTTIAAHLNDLETGEVVAAAGVMNPQIRFGEDLISRVSFIQRNPDDAGELTRVARAALAELAEETARMAGIEAADILELTIVGNSIMHHILLGIDPLQLGQAPFPLAVDRDLTIKATELDIGTVDPGARVYVLPCIAGHVGADAAGVVLSEGPHLANKITLIVDVGTNAEIILGNKDRLLAASSPTGPAFEGAQISCGQRAALGAIERVRIDPETLAPRFRVIGCELWSDDPGFEQAITGFGVSGICGSGIIEAVAEMYIAGLLDKRGLIDGAQWPGNPHLIPDGEVFGYQLRGGNTPITVTQTNVRNIQLAKAALYAGARLLMDKLEVDTPDRIVLAGAFGSFIDPRHAMVLGMIPDCPLDRVRAAGNAAGTGARIALLNRTARAEIAELTRTVEKVETAAHASFQKSFVDAMGIPHGKHEFVHLAAALERPEEAAPERKTG